MNSGSLSDYEIKQRGDIPEEAKIIKKDITSKTEINVTYEYNGEERTKKIIYFFFHHLFFLSLPYKNLLMTFIFYHKKVYF